MHRELAERLACPETGNRLSLVEGSTGAAGESVESGVLQGGARPYEIVRGIPRFVSSDAYASSFSSQRQRWATTQLYSVNGSGVFRARFERYIGDPERLEGMSVLDGGCGAGAFLDVVAPHADNVVGVDLSGAVESAYASLGQRPNASCRVTCSRCRSQTSPSTSCSASA